MIGPCPESGIATVFHALKGRRIKRGEVIEISSKND
jgi:hypothetical protein